MENTENKKIVHDLRQSEEYGNFIRKLGWKTIKIGEIQIFIKQLGPVSIAKLQRVNLPLPWAEIKMLLKKERSMMCIIEPLSGSPEEFKKHGFKINKEPLLGTKTLRVDLRPKEEVIFGSFNKDCRYCIRKIQTTNPNSQMNKFADFYEIWKKSAKRKNLWIPPEKDYLSLIESFGKNVYCITTGKDAGALILIYKKTAFYYYAGGTSEGTLGNLPYLVVWEAMKEARKRSCDMWDFEGIYDTRWPNKGWQGFTHFKKSFGGTEIEYPGSFIKWRWPF